MIYDAEWEEDGEEEEKGEELATLNNIFINKTQILSKWKLSLFTVRWFLTTKTSPNENHLFLTRAVLKLWEIVCGRASHEAKVVRKSLTTHQKLQKNLKMTEVLKNSALLANIWQRISFYLTKTHHCDVVPSWFV